jgi:putative SOS response-associated peptidase YedK
LEEQLPDHHPMCGRFSQAQIAELDREIYRLLNVPALPSRYNVAPTQDAAVVRERDGARSLELLRWGLIPYWAQDPAIGNRMINARAESLSEKPAFKEAYQRRRCLIPARGFYEWRKAGSLKQPYYVRLADNGVFAMAGLWERWRDEAHETIETFTVITTAPNTLLRPIHDRMPAILEPSEYDRWLDPDVSDPRALAILLHPYRPEAMAAYPVSRYVNRPENEGPECVRPVDDDGTTEGRRDAGTDGRQNGRTERPSDDGTLELGFGDGTPAA